MTNSGNHQQLEDLVNDSSSSVNHGQPGESATWFCIRTQPRRESFAHAFLKKLENVETCLPRIQFRGTGRRKGQLIIEPLFPGYLFCQFKFHHQLRAVTYSPGVQGLIRFGNHYPILPVEVIKELQSVFRSDEPIMVDHSVRIGDRVVIETGPMRGHEGIVCRILPGQARVALLLEFLGQQTQVEIDVNQIETSRYLRSKLI